MKPFTRQRAQKKTDQDRNGISQHATHADTKHIKCHAACGEGWPCAKEPEKRSKSLARVKNTVSKPRALIRDITRSYVAPFADEVAARVSACAEA